MIHRTLFGHRKLSRLCEALGISRPTAIGHLACLWYYTGEQYPDGNLRDLSDGELATAAEWAGDPAAFVGALTAAGFIDRTDKGTEVHDFTDHCQDYIHLRRKRARERAEKRRSTEGSLPAGKNPPSCSSKLSDHAVGPCCPSKLSGHAGAPNGTEPNGTEPNGTEPNGTAPSAPSGSAPLTKLSKAPDLTQTAERGLRPGGPPPPATTLLAGYKLPRTVKEVMAEVDAEVDREIEKEADADTLGF